MEYYSAISKNEIMPFAATWMDLQSVTLTEDREEKYHRTLLTYAASKMIQIFLLTKQKQIHRLKRSSLWLLGKRTGRIR